MRSIRSALAEPEVGEVMVVDDGSQDRTGDLARGCDDGTGRLTIVRFEVNRGPSAARNEALRRTTRPLVAILDADDFVLSGRFRRMLAAGGEDWDFLADDLVLVSEEILPASSIAVPASAMALLPGRPQVLCDVSAEAFVLANISRPSRPRRELAFVKPIIRRAFLERHGIWYTEALRLGEDFVLYVESLIAGACFRLLEPCGYIATVRPSSLSSIHGRHEHEIMLEIDQSLLAKAAGREALCRALELHRDQVQRKLDHRQVLDARHEKGYLFGIAEALRRPRSLLSFARQTVRSKLRLVPAPPALDGRGAALLVGRDGLSDLL